MRIITIGVTTLLTVLLSTIANADAPVGPASGVDKKLARCLPDFEVEVSLAWSNVTYNKSRYSVDDLGVRLNGNELLTPDVEQSSIAAIGRWLDAEKPRRVVIGTIYCPSPNRLTIGLDVLHDRYEGSSREEILSLRFLNGKTSGLIAHRVRDGYGAWVPAETAEIPRP
jgi:hypothetical protein